MSLIGKEISDFTVQAYAGGAFREVKKSDVLGKWAVFFFYPADFTFVCPTELEDLADKYELSVNSPGIFCELTGDFPEISINCRNISINHQVCIRLSPITNQANIF